MAGPVAPSSSIFQPEPTPPDSLASTEAALLANGQDLKIDEAKKEHSRHQFFRDHVNNAALLLFWAIALCLFWGVLVFTWHILMPVNWHYLNHDQLETLKTLLGAAIFSSALSGYIGKRMA